jgi:hypothetical protein
VRSIKGAMMATCVTRWISCGCLVTTLVTTAIAQSPPERNPIRTPATVDLGVRSSPKSLAAALRASTRNDSASFVPPISLLEGFLNGAHTGPVEGAVVGVEVTNEAKGGITETRRCSGLLIRCDGFVLMPPGVTSLTMATGVEAAKQTVRATVHPELPDQQQAYGYIRHYIVADIDLTVIKLQGIHAPAARPLMPYNLKPGDKVEIVWTDWDANARRFGAVKRRNATIGVQPTSETSLKSPSWHAGEIRLTELQQGIPGGAAVIADGMAVGLLPGPATRHDRFVSFSVLDRITNCVAAASTTDADFKVLEERDREELDHRGAEDTGAAVAGGDPSETRSKGANGNPRHVVNDMVEIPGGPVRLPAVFQRDQRDMCGEVIACVPPFKIDRFKVSNREYYDFWKSIPEQERNRKEVRVALYPIAWADADPPFPAEIDDVPVLGVPVTGARAYAHSKGKRLPTSYEWSRAAFGPFGDAVLPVWVYEYLHDRQLAWARIAAAHDQHLISMVPGLVRERQLEEFDRLAGRPVVVHDIQGPGTIPFIDTREEFRAADLWSASIIHEEVARLCDKWINPLYVLPAGSRPFDTSPFGVHDVILNGNERIIYSPEADIGSDGALGGRPQTVEIGWNIQSPIITVSWKALMTPMWLRPAEVPVPVTADEVADSACPLLLSRRLVSASSLARPEMREFAPSDAEAYTEHCARIYEELTMALPIKQMCVRAIRHETVNHDAWGEGLVGTEGHDGNPHHNGNVGSTHFWNSNGSPPDSPPPAKRLAGHPLPQVIEGWRQAYIGKKLVSIPIYSPYLDSLSTMEGTGVRLDEAEILFQGIYFDETPFYPAWQGLSPFMRREMGRDIAKDPPVRVGAWPIWGASLRQPPDIYLIPNGFRCAR